MKLKLKLLETTNEDTYTEMWKFMNKNIAISSLTCN